MKKAFGFLFSAAHRLPVCLLALLFLTPAALAAPDQPTVELTHSINGDMAVIEATAKVAPPESESESRVTMDFQLRTGASVTLDPSSVQVLYQSEDGETSALSRGDWDADPSEGLISVYLEVDTDMGGQLLCRFNAELSQGTSATNTAQISVTYRDLETGSQETQSASDKDEIKLAPVKTGYDLTLDLNGGSLTGKNSTFVWQEDLAQGSQVNLADLPAPSRDGYFFDGWKVSSGADAKISGGVLTVGSGDVTLQAVWTSKADKLTLDLNGGSGRLVTISGNTGDAVTLPAPSEVLYSRDGYKLAGWSTTPDGTSGKVYTGGESYTLTREEDVLYAWWAPQYTLSYDGNGGTGQMPRRIFSANEKAVISENSFKRTGYDFTGWCASPDGRGTLYKSGDTLELTGDTTLYAQWEKVYETPGEAQTDRGGSHLPLLLGILAAVAVIGGICGFLVWRSRRNDDGPYDDGYDGPDDYDRRDYPDRDEYDDGYEDRYDDRFETRRIYEDRPNGRDRYDDRRPRYDESGGRYDDRGDPYRDRRERERYDSERDRRSRRRYDDRYDD